MRFMTKNKKFDFMNVYVNKLFYCLSVHSLKYIFFIFIPKKWKYSDTSELGLEYFVLCLKCLDEFKMFNAFFRHIYSYTKNFFLFTHYNHWTTKVCVMSKLLSLEKRWIELILVGFTKRQNKNKKIHYKRYLQKIHFYI